MSNNDNIIETVIDKVEKATFCICPRFQLYTLIRINSNNIEKLPTNDQLEVIVKYFVDNFTEETTSNLVKVGLESALLPIFNMYAWSIKANLKRLRDGKGNPFYNFRDFASGVVHMIAATDDLSSIKQLIESADLLEWFSEQLKTCLNHVDVDKWIDHLLEKSDTYATPQGHAQLIRKIRQYVMDENKKGELKRSSLYKVLGTNH